MSSPQLPSSWAFDIDGVLADTKYTVREAYHRAGVDMPDEAWGLNWRIWLPSLVGDHADAIHALKNEIYVKLLQTEGVKLLPGAAMARALLNDGQSVFFVTSASHDAAAAILSAAGLSNEDPSCELLRHERVVILSALYDSERSSSHTYVDDREEGASIAADAGWLFAHARWTQ